MHVNEVVYQREPKIAVKTIVCLGVFSNKGAILLAIAIKAQVCGSLFNLMNH